MRLGVDELEGRLKGGLLPVYLVAGDEPLQLGEAAQCIRDFARKAGYGHREVLEVGPGFDWAVFGAAAHSLSLFSEQRILDLRLTSFRVDKQGVSALVQFAEQPPAGTLLLITCPKLDRGAKASRWFRAVASSGAVVQVWPLSGDRLTAWIARRMAKRGMTAQSGVAAMVAERTEGNLLAAAQEIEKLSLLRGPGPIGRTEWAESVADGARFDVYDLVDAALEGRVARVLRIFLRVRAEGVPAAVVLWGLSREIRAMASMSFRIQRGEAIESTLDAFRVWGSRKPVVRRGLRLLDLTRWQMLLRRCASADRVLKGRERGDPWRELMVLGSTLAGALRSDSSDGGGRAAGRG